MTRTPRFGLPSFRAILLSSAAIVAIGATARAETGPLPGAGPWLSVEGRYAWQSGSRQPWAAFGNDGSSSTALSEVFQDRVKSAWGGRAVLGIRIDQTWDLAVAYTGLTGNKEKDSVAASGNVVAVLGPYKTYWNAAHLEIRNTLQSGDFEVGYNMGLGRGRARLFGGVRLVSFDQHTHVNFEYPNYTSFDDKRTRFLGAGPRIGASGEWPVAALGRGQLKLIGSIGGSVVVGESSQRWRGFSESSGSISEDLGEKERRATVAYGVEAELGGAYEFMLGTMPLAVAAGYRFDGWFGINDTRTAVGQPGSGLLATQPGRLGSSSGDVLYHGPFVRLTMQF